MEARRLIKRLLSALAKGVTAGALVVLVLLAAFWVPAGLLLLMAWIFKVGGTPAVLLATIFFVVCYVVTIIQFMG